MPDVILSNYYQVLRNFKGELWYGMLFSGVTRFIAHSLYVYCSERSGLMIAMEICQQVELSV